MGLTNSIAGVLSALLNDASNNSIAIINTEHKIKSLFMFNDFPLTSLLSF